ncbi:dihydrofolate reductase [Lichenibacterium dinghuense]|uniref:dihydrofolate reductase n=1 Tax=Lichenibacterium dinghuense TaxID=2895977 RepID=UPI001F17FA37|nr:dihydrofolate reductase [Lichenibacterium sp. 6Y81]
MTVPVVLIAAVGRNGAIGLRDGLPWRLPSDLRQFKAETVGKPVVMGRKTFASLGRPLPGRHLVVVSRDPAPALPEGVAGATSVEGALALAQRIAAERGAAEVMVAGGAEIYRAAMPLADALRITEVDLEPAADSFFPAVEPAVWRELSREMGERGERDEAGFAVVRYGRR